MGVTPASVVSALRTPTRPVVVRSAAALLVANTVIILTGGLVRLTGSGLGCPTWPRCTDASFTPHRELGVHGVIEFGNRLLTYVLIGVAVVACVAVWRWADARRSDRRLVLLLTLGIPFQGVIGGITVLTDLNPWIVALHLIFSLVLVAGSTVLLLSVLGRTAPAVPAGVSRLSAVVLGVLWVVVYLGTVVTGSGPHAGDVKAPRNGLDPHVMSHVHAFSVYLLVALTVVLLWKSRGTAAHGAVAALLVGELAQGVIGFVQYFTDLPIALVAIHLVGASVLVALGTRLVLVTRTASVPEQPHAPVIGA